MNTEKMREEFEIAKPKPQHLWFCEDIDQYLTRPGVTGGKKDEVVYQAMWEGYQIGAARTCQGGI